MMKKLFCLLLAIVLLALPFTAVHGSVRFSLSRYTTAEEIDYVLEKLPPVIHALRELSPFGPGKGPTTFA